jgi:hypothetical protein
MIKKQNIFSSLAIAAIMTFTSTAAMAHSAHDHSTVSYKWALSKSLKNKINNRLNSSNPTSMIGLSHLEQKKLQHYDIKVGNKFQTELSGINFLVQRTSAGMNIVKATRASRVAYTDQVPIKNTNIFSKASINQNSHAGHDHSYLPYEWTFSLVTQNKIAKAMIRGNKNILIGLNAFEQSILKEYEIKPGNTFHTKIKGHQFMIEKASSGIKVISHTEPQDIAMANHNNENL